MHRRCRDGLTGLLALRIAGGFFAFVLAFPSLALTDLVIGLIPASSRSSPAVGDVAYGVIGVVLIAPAFASHVRRPESRVAPLQQIALVTLVLACAAVASGSYVGIVGAGVVLVPLLVLFALHPRRREMFSWPRRPSIPLLLLALAAVGPTVTYAWKMATNGRAGLPPEDSYAFVPTVWSAAAAMALATVLVSVLAALRPPGWKVPARCAAAAAFLFGIASLVNPDVAAGGGRGWGAAAVVWSAAWLATTIRQGANE